MDFKAFDRVWHAALWAAMKCNISVNLIQIIRNFYDKAASAVLFNCSIGGWFLTTDGVRQGCLLSPTIFNIFLEMIMTGALEDLKGIVSFEGRTITNLAKLPECLDKASTAYGLEISAEKTKLMKQDQCHQHRV